MIDFELIRNMLPAFGVAAWHTVVLVSIAATGGLLLGFAINMLRIFGGKTARAMVRVYSSVLRFTPFLAQLFIIYFGLPALGLTLSPLQAAAIMLAVYSSAYFAEIFRSCWDTIPHGQREAAATLGISRLKAFRAIEMPQALAMSVPLLANQVILTLKESALASIITYPELTMTTGRIVAEQFTYFEPYLLLSVCYWLMTLLIGAAGRRLGSYFPAPTRSPR
jgi:polar amino acid transport system permease protein